MKFRVHPILAFATGAALAGSAGAQVPWVPAAGAGSFFNYSSGQNSNSNLFGSPVLVGNTFQFFPLNFQAQSLNGVAGAASDQMNVRLTAFAGQRFTQIMIQEFGSWAISGVGTVQDSGSMLIQDMVTPRGPAIQALSTNPGMPLSTPGSGNWSGLVTIDLNAIAGPAWTDITLVFTNTLQATTQGVGSASNIRKELVSGPAVIVTVFPTPGSGAILAAGCLAAFRRRRR